MSDDSKKSKKNIWNIFAPILVVLAIFLAFVVGSLLQRVRMLEGGTGIGLFGTGNQKAAGNPAPAAPQPADGKLSEAQASKLPQVTKDDHILGDFDSAKIFLVEYSDYECPFCKQFHTTAKQAVEQYDGEVAWVYRHFPLTSLHPKAQPAAEAAECVASLGGNDSFWTFTDAAFEGAPASLSDLPSLATSAGVDETAFNDCFESEEFKSAVNDDYSEGSAAGVTGTPGNFIVNAETGETWLVPGAVPYESLKAVIDEALGSS